MVYIMSAYRAARRACRGAGGSWTTAWHTAGDVAASQSDGTIVYGRNHRLLGVRRRTTSQGAAKSNR